MRIYSFLQSTAEMVYVRGLGDQFCGVTSECDFPRTRGESP